MEMAFGKERLMQLYICIVDVPEWNMSWHNEANSLDVEFLDKSNISASTMSPGILMEKII